MNDVERENRNLKKYLKHLVQAVEHHIRALDVEMGTPSTVERGQRIARLSNSLEWSKDECRFYALGIDPHTGKQRKP